MAFIPDRAFHDIGEISPKAFVLFGYYCKHGGRDKPSCSVSLERAASDLRMDYTYASRKRKELVTAGWIAVLKDAVYILKGIEDYTERAQAEVANLANILAKTASTEVAKTAKTAPPQLLKQQEKVAKLATKNCENSKSYIKDEPASLTSPFNQEEKAGDCSSNGTPPPPPAHAVRHSPAVQLFHAYFPGHNLAADDIRRIAGAVTDLGVWESEVLDYWVANHYRPSSVGKMLDRYGEQTRLQAGDESDGTRDGKLPRRENSSQRTVRLLTERDYDNLFGSSEGEGGGGGAGQEPPRLRLAPARERSFASFRARLG